MKRGAPISDAGFVKPGQKDVAIMRAEYQERREKVERELKKKALLGASMEPGAIVSDAGFYKPGQKNVAVIRAEYQEKIGKISEAKEEHQADLYEGYDAYYAGRYEMIRLMGTPSTRRIRGVSREVVERALRSADYTLKPEELTAGGVFVYNLWESSPFGMVTREKPISMKTYEDKRKWAALSGQVGGELAWIGAGYLGGYTLGITGIGSLVSGPFKYPRLASAYSGILKGTILGFEVSKGVIKYLEGYSFPEVAVDVAGDIASLGAFEYGFRTTSPRPIIIERKFGEGSLVEVQEFGPGGKPARVEKILRVKSPKADLAGMSVYSPTSKEFAVSMRGTYSGRLIDFRMTTGPSSATPEAVKGVTFLGGGKFLISSKGGGTAMALYDPLLEQIPRAGYGIRTYLSMLKPTPFIKPPSPDVLTAGIQVVAVSPSLKSSKGKGGSGKRGNKGQGSGLKLDVDTNIEPGQVEEPSFDIDVKVEPKQVVSKERGLEFKQEVKSEQRPEIDKDIRPDITLLHINAPEPIQTQAPKIGVGQARVEEFRWPEETKPPRFAYRYKLKPGKPMPPSTPSKPALGIGGSKIPNLLKEGKANKKRKKRGKSKLLGEIDLLEATKLDLLGIEKVTIDVKRFRKLFSEGRLWGAEPIELIGKKKRKKRGGKKKKKSKRWGLL